MISFVPSSTTDNGIQYRLAKLNEIKQKIFDLVYYGHFGFGELGAMTMVELNWYHSKLIEIKDKENEARDKALREARNKQAQARAISKSRAHHARNRAKNNRIRRR